MAIANQENFKVPRKRQASFDRMMILGIFAPCLLFWTLVVAALIRVL